MPQQLFSIRCFKVSTQTEQQFFALWSRRMGLLKRQFSVVSVVWFSQISVDFKRRNDKPKSYICAVYTLNYKSLNFRRTIWHVVISVCGRSCSCELQERTSSWCDLFTVGNTCWINDLLTIQYVLSKGFSSLTRMMCTFIYFWATCGQWNKQ